jgi:hypothetical protein
MLAILSCAAAVVGWDAAPPVARAAKPPVAASMSLRVIMKTSWDIAGFEVHDAPARAAFPIRSRLGMHHVASVALAGERIPRAVTAIYEMALPRLAAIICKHL